MVRSANGGTKMKVQKLWLIVGLLLGVSLLLTVTLNPPTFTSQKESTTSNELAGSEKMDTPVIHLDEESPEQTVGINRWNKAPDFTLTDEQGREISLSQFAGKKVLLNFWASWCPPCKKEMPDLIRIYEKNKDQNVVVLGVNVTTEEKSIDNAILYMKEAGISFPVVYDVEGEVTELYRIQGYPTSYFIDTNGVIQQKVLGAIVYDDVETILRDMN